MQPEAAPITITKELPYLAHRNGLMYLEGKIKCSLNIEDIKQAVVPKDCPEELMNKLNKLGIPVKVLKTEKWIKVNLYGEQC